MFASLHLITDTGKVMAKGWTKRWNYRGKGHRPSHIEALDVKKNTTFSDNEWELPPSKSHLIRMMLLCALSKDKHTLTGITALGEDPESMARCLEQLGVKFTRIEDRLSIQGAGLTGFVRPPSVLHAGNSGTALRFLMGLASRTEHLIMIDGDSSLRNRDHQDILNSLNSLGVKCSYGTEQERLPVLLQGPWEKYEMNVNTAKSSQPFSSLLLATEGIKQSCSIKISSESVSKRHAQLTMDLMSECGANIEQDGKIVTVQPWKSAPPNQWQVPSDASMLAFTALSCVLSRREIKIANLPTEKDSIGHEVLLETLPEIGLKLIGNTLTPSENYNTVDFNLVDANDLLPPLSAILALTGGGTISGAAHAMYKESDRIAKTAEMLQLFGIDCIVKDDGITIEGNQSIKKPTSLVQTFGDHRLQMTAILLATQVGATVEGPRLHQVADPSFLDRLSTMPTEVLVKGVQRES
jgi:3-phosphoshikimate 1-carboxyvinyltransferase